MTTYTMERANYDIIQTDQDRIALQADQAFHLDRMRQHDECLHAPGVLSGLDLAAGGSNMPLTVLPGAAVDETGKRIVCDGTFDNDVQTDLQTAAAQGGTFWVSISYDLGAQVTGPTLREAPRLTITKSDGAPSDGVVLGKATFDRGGALLSTSTEGRIYAGARLPRGAGARDLRASDLETLEREIEKKANADGAATKEELAGGLALKANVADAATKQELRSGLELKANVADAATKQELSDGLDLKANATDAATKRDLGEIHQELAKKATTQQIDDINQELAKKAATQQIDDINQELAKKATTQQYGELSQELAKKATTQQYGELSQELVKKATKQEVNELKQEVAQKATKQDVSELKQEVAQKATKQQLNDGLALKANVEDTATKEAVGTLEQEVGALKQEVGTLKQEVGTLKQELAKKATKQELGDGSLNLDVARLTFKGAWSLKGEGNSLVLRHNQKTVAFFSLENDLFRVFQNLDGKAPYFRFNSQGEYGLYQKPELLLVTVPDVVGDLLSVAMKSVEKAHLTPRPNPPLPSKPPVEAPELRPPYVVSQKPKKGTRAFAGSEVELKWEYRPIKPIELPSADAGGSEGGDDWAESVQERLASLQREREATLALLAALRDKEANLAQTLTHIVRATELLQGLLDQEAEPDSTQSTQSQPEST